MNIEFSQNIGNIYIIFHSFIGKERVRSDKLVINSVNIMQIQSFCSSFSHLIWPFL